MEHYGIGGNLLRWVENFLVGRSQFVKYSGASFEPTEVPSCVIQGSVLGPLLFIVYVADLPEGLKCDHNQYADDATLSKTILSDEDAAVMQQDLDNLFVWCDGVKQRNATE